MSATLCSLALLLTGADAKPTGYPRPELLLEADQLVKPAVARKFVVLDARSRSAYAAGHVPGAVWVDVDGWARAFASGRDPKAWSKRVGDLGITADTPVVVYGVGRAPDAARVWWILRYWGVRDVRLLNGGWPAWVAAGGKADKKENKLEAVEAKLAPQPARLATKEQLLAWLEGKAGKQVLDARTNDEYCGVEKKA